MTTKKGSDFSATDDLYGILGVGPDATTKEIEKAYRNKARGVHPDKQQKQNTNTSDLFLKLHHAKEVLVDPEARKAYDNVVHARNERIRRESAMSNERKRMVDSLQQREEVAALKKRNPLHSVLDNEKELQRKLEAEIERLRASGQLSEEQQEESDDDDEEVEEEKQTTTPVNTHQQKPKRPLEELEADVLGRMRAIAEATKKQKTT